MKLILITNPVDVPEEHSILERILSSGNELLHVRKANKSRDEMMEFLRPLLKWKEKISIHSHHSLAEELESGGIHFKSETRKAGGLNFPPGKRFSTSIHDPGEISELDERFSYAFFSPVFSSVSKKGYGPDDKTILPEKKFTDSKVEIIALGGITTKTITRVPGFFKGAAVLGSVWGSKDPFAEFRKLRALAAGRP